MTPFQALYGQPLRAIQTYFIGFSPIEAIDTELITREDVLQQLK